MKRITKIRLSDYRAFYGLEDKFEMLNGENVLIYGENGSGKSSLYHALSDFFESSAHGYDFAQKPLTENLYKRKEVDEGQVGSTIQSRLDVVFKDITSNVETDYSAIDTRLSTHRELFIQNTRLVGGFLSYKELIGLYVGKDNRLNHFDLIIGLAHNHTSPHISKTIGQEWRNLQGASTQKATTRHRSNMQTWVNNFNLAVNEYLRNLKVSGHLDIILSKHFEHNVTIEFEYIGIVYAPNHHSNFRIHRKDLYFDISFDNKRLSDYGFEYQNFLNEARLSALAISIYLASIKSYPSILDYKILFLDDVFLGLDMSNRLPLLSVLKEYFSDYQIFISTYDRHWYEVAKHHLKGWKTFEMYVGKEQKDKPQYPVVITPSDNYVEKARKYRDAKDYATSSNYLRKELESLIKERLIDEKVRSYEGKPHALSHLWELFVERYSGTETKVDADVKALFDSTRLVLLNPQSHDGLHYPVYENELKQAFDLVSKIKAYPIIKSYILLSKGMVLKFSHPSVNYTFELEFITDWRIEKHNQSISAQEPKCKVIHWQFEGQAFWYFKSNAILSTNAVQVVQNRQDPLSKIVENLKEITALNITDEMFIENTMIDNNWLLKEVLDSFWKMMTSV